MRRLAEIFRGQGLAARAIRSSTWTVLGYGGSQFMRLAANLILTRLLFPEAFGIMALVQVFMMGLAMFSDLGVSPAIMASKRGDDQEFLDTAWTIQVLRGVSLWLVACGLALPLAGFYGEPQLAQLIPVAAISLVIIGFNPTRLDTANRHLLLGRVTSIDLVTQIIGIISAILFAWIFQSVWALVFSGLISAVAQLLFYSILLPGQRNRFRWEKPAAQELIHFGKWIFLSTVAGFLYGQGDRVVLGKFLNLEQLGIYNIGFFLASFPLLLGGALVRKIMIPLYRERPPAASKQNFLKLRKLRVGLTVPLLAIVVILACFGDTLIGILYDPRYSGAGAIAVLIAIGQILPIITVTYDQSALAAGNARQFFVLAASKAFLMIAGLLVGVQTAGLFGALIGQGLAMILIYPVTAWLARRQGAWDPWHDAGFTALGLVGAGLAIWLNMDVLQALIDGF
jgi:O-antigen/teichoic acid export membrane protein